MAGRPDPIEMNLAKVVRLGVRAKMEFSPSMVVEEIDVLGGAANSKY
jgi:hypothetical protein